MQTTEEAMNSIVENTQGLMDKSLLLDQDVQTSTIIETSIPRKEELIVSQQSIQDQIDSLKQKFSIGEREQKGISLFENNHVDIHDEEESSVLSEEGGKEYTVNKRNGTCTCKDHEFTSQYGVICKHRIADRLARDAVDTAQNAEIPEIVTFADIGNDES